MKIVIESNQESEKLEEGIWKGGKSSAVCVVRGVLKS